MKRTGWTLVAFAAAAALALLSGDNAAAMTGACKERTSSVLAWQGNGLAFEACKALNQQRDGDDVFDERGLVWWNIRG